MERDYPPKSGVLPQYKHLRGFEENMVEIRKILGVPPGGTMPDNFIGRTMQNFIEANRQENVRKSRIDFNKTPK